MEQKQPNQYSAQLLIDKDLWWDILSKFIDVLRMNIFIVDAYGKIILPSEGRRFGGRLLIDSRLAFDLHQDSPDFLERFQSQGRFLESVNRYDLHTFALPIQIEENTPLAYLIVGPVILNKRLLTTEYEQLAREYNVEQDALVDEINAIRVVSNIMMNSILDLLLEISRKEIECTIRERNQIQKQTESGEDQRDVTHEIYSDVNRDKLLLNLLDIALKITNTENGSIMLLDSDFNELTVKMHKGLISADKIKNTRVKIGEGISGLAARNKRMYVLAQDKTEAEPDIAQFLNRPEIKKSLVMPLIAKNRVFGVLNVHTYEDNDTIDQNIDNIKYISEMLSPVF
jgi:putative methionine-R-sulfoxide reductase with GAF domain